MRDDQSPSIEALSKTSLTPNSVIQINGTIFTDIIASSNATATNGNNATLNRVYLTSGDCNLYKDVDELLVCASVYNKYFIIHKITLFNLYRFYFITNSLATL